MTQLLPSSDQAHLPSGKRVRSGWRIMPLLLLLLLTQAIRGHAQHGIRYRLSFHRTDTVLGASGKKTLDSLITFGVIHANSRFVVYSHSGDRVLPVINGQRAKRRALAIDRYLRSRGFQSQRITSHWGDGIPSDSDVIQINYVEVLPGPPPPAGAVSKALDTTALNGAFVLHNILFIDGKDTLLPESLPVLTELYDALAASPRLRIRLEGHVCCGATDAAGWDLSRRRAVAVRDVLLQKGIGADRLETEGFGFSHPLHSPEKNGADKKANRRVEVRILAR